jgi:hypothetical protein
MKPKYPVMVIFCIIIAAFIITYITESPTTHPAEQYASASTTSILNQNKLNVIFPGQNLIIKSKNTSVSVICYSIYDDAWLPEKRAEAHDGSCYDLEGNTVADCGPESDLETKDGTIKPLNGAEMITMAPQNFYDTEFLCSSTIPETFYDGYKEDICSKMNNPQECIDYPGVAYYNSDWRVHVRWWPKQLCIITGSGNHFKYKINDYSIEQKQERVPLDMLCKEADKNTIVVETNSLENGIHHIAYSAEDSSGNREKTRTYTFLKTDSPYSSVSNPNTGSMIYPYKEETFWGYLFNEFLINAEYTEDLTAIWYSCDGGEWHRADVEGRFAHARIYETLCNSLGKHTVSYFAESSGINGTIYRYTFFQNTERPTTEKPSISMERASNKYVLEASYGFNSPAGLPESETIVEWYENGTIIGYGKSIEVPGGSSITARLTSIDVSGLGSTPVNISIKVPNEPPQARDVNISVHFKYPPVLVAEADYHDPDSTPEGESLCRWYKDRTLISEGRELIPDSYISGEVTIEYTPVDSAGMAGNQFTKTISVPEDTMDTWLYFNALYHSNTTHCESIRNASLKSECLETVNLAISECSGRSQREKFFCLAFLKNDPNYCRYIDIEWYRTNCLVFISGSPEGCMSLDSANRDSCIMEFASSTGNPDLCTNITNPDTKTLCVSLADKNPDLCSSISDPSMRDRCSSDASYR